MKKDYADRDRAVVWHPFTQMKNAGPHIPIVRGEGVMLFDDNGKSYIDAISSWWVNVHGHCHPHITKMVSRQLATLEHVIFAGFTHPWAIELSERVLALQTAGHGKVFFSDNGSTAVEVGLKMALQYWWNQGKPKRRIIALEDAYHGDTVGAMSAGGRGSFSNPFEDLLFEVVHLPTPMGSNNAEVLQQMERVLQSGDVAVFVYEPVIQGAAGMKVYDKEGMGSLLELAHQHDALLFADEVMTGFGRTGKLFASEFYSTQPDIMALSKALTGGTMPLSLTTCRQSIYDQFLSDDKGKTFFHGHSYTGNPTACAAALASLDLIEDPAYQLNMQRIEKQHKIFASELREHPLTKQVRVQGTLLAFEIAAEGSDSYFHEIRDTLYHSFIEQGVLLRPLGNTVYILPPFIITDSQLELVYQAIRVTLGQLQEAG